MREQEVSKALEEIFGHKLEDKEFEYNKKIKKTLANTIEKKVNDNEIWFLKVSLLLLGKKLKINMKRNLTYRVL